MPLLLEASPANECAAPQQVRETPLVEASLDEIADITRICLVTSIGVRLHACLARDHQPSLEDGVEKVCDVAWSPHDSTVSGGAAFAGIGPSSVLLSTTEPHGLEMLTEPLCLSSVVAAYRSQSYSEPQLDASIVSLEKPVGRKRRDWPRIGLGDGPTEAACHRALAASEGDQHLLHAKGIAIAALTESEDRSFQSTKRATYGARRSFLARPTPEGVEPLVELDEQERS